MNVDIKDLIEDSSILFLHLTHKSYPSFHNQTKSEIFFVPKTFNTIVDTFNGGNDILKCFLENSNGRN